MPYYRSAAVVGRHGPHRVSVATVPGLQLVEGDEEPSRVTAGPYVETASGAGVTDRAEAGARLFEAIA